MIESYPASAATGGDVGFGAGVGAVTAFVGFEAAPLGIPGQLGLGAASGCATSAVMGGSCGEGARMGAISAAISIGVNFAANETFQFIKAVVEKLSDPCKGNLCWYGSDPSSPNARLNYKFGGKSYFSGTNVGGKVIPGGSPGDILMDIDKVYIPDANSPDLEPLDYRPLDNSPDRFTGWSVRVQALRVNASTATLRFDVSILRPGMQIPSSPGIGISGCSQGGCAQWISPNQAPWFK